MAKLPRRAPPREVLTAYQPTLRDKAANLFLRYAGDNYQNQQLVANVLGSHGLGQSKTGLVDFTPAGLPFAGDEGGRKIANGNLFSGLLDVGLAAIPIPGAAKNGAKTTAKSSLREIERAAAEMGVDLYVHETPRGITISKIVVPKEARGQGVGSAVMRNINSYADQTGQRVMLTPDGSFGGSVPRLKKFYAEHGFIPNAGRSKDYSISETMFRAPLNRSGQ